VEKSLFITLTEGMKPCIGLGWLKKGLPPNENVNYEKALFPKEPKKEKSIDPIKVL